MQISTATSLTVQRMVDLIEKRYTDRITVKSVSTALRGKPGTLGRLFQSVLGVSVHDYVTRVRLDHAAHFIRGGLKIEAVALSVGYRSKKNFYRQFTKHFGITPETYRRRRRTRSSDEGAARGVRRGGNGSMNTFAAIFADMQCLIDVEARPNLRGAPSFHAKPFVKADYGLQPFAVASDHLELTGETEADAVERAALFLEHRFGPRASEPKRHSNGALPILTPRR